MHFFIVKNAYPERNGGRQRPLKSQKGLTTPNPEKGADNPPNPEKWVNNTSTQLRKCQVLKKFLMVITGSVTRSGYLLDFGQLFKPLAPINLPKSLTILDNFCKGIKNFIFSSEIIFGQLL